MEGSYRVLLPGPLGSCLQDYARRTGRTPREILMPLVEKRLTEVGYTEDQLWVTGIAQDNIGTGSQGEEHVELAGSYYLLPASSGHIQMDALAYTHLWLDRGWWGMGESTPNRRKLKADDKVCFYVVGYGVAATATVAGAATSLLAKEDLAPELVDYYSTPPYGVPLENVKWLDPAVVITAEVRAALDAFEGKAVTGKSWAWLVQTSRTLSAHDYRIITGETAPNPATSAA
jgi:hypothetical protein